MTQPFEEPMLQFMGDNKMLLNLHEHKVTELEAFKSITHIFQTNTSTSLKNLETRVGKLALTLQKETKNAFPSDTQKNLKDCMAVQLRSGKEASSSSRAKENEKTDQKEEKATVGDNGKSITKRTTEIDKEVQTEHPEKSCEQKQKEKVQAYTLAIPFPQRIQKARKEEQFSKFLEIFKKIEINIPFTEAINQMPNYEKFLKEILSKKKKIAKDGIVNLIATCSAVIQRSLPAKMKDPGSFTIPAQ